MQSVTLVRASRLAGWPRRDHEAHRHTLLRHAAIPTPERLDADRAATGRKVTMAFVDSGFFPHPDLTRPRSRVLAYHDVTDPDAVFTDQKVDEIYRWHGTQTTVSAAGNGYLSAGRYRGLAPDANLVLVKVRGEVGGPEENLLKGLDWIVQERERLGIRIVSISVGGGHDQPIRGNAVDRRIEEMVRAGLIVVCAAGNSGCSEHHLPIAPATAASAITVGGYDDHNELGREVPGLYCSSFGPNPDGVMKPEIIGPAAWVAAPILPETPLYRRAEALTRIATAPEFEIGRVAGDLREVAQIPESALTGSREELRAWVEEVLAREKVVSAHYQHVNGTSFAAPIVASVIAQMLEVDPNLTPVAVKRILIQTADRIYQQSVARQGFGRISPRRAVEVARSGRFVTDEARYLAPHVVGDRLVFYFHDHHASEVCLAGSFNGWSSRTSPLRREPDGVWTIQIPALPPGAYPYKFVIDGSRWVEDPGNDVREPDGRGGYNAILHVRAMYPAVAG